jgi:hypothetical protein
LAPPSGFPDLPMSRSAASRLAERGLSLAKDSRSLENGGERDLHVRRGSVSPWGNASPKVQRPARRVTTSDEDEGFANAVERFVLP